MNVIYLGIKNFPYGLAKTQKILLICKALASKNINVTVINRESYNGYKIVSKHENIKIISNYIYNSSLRKISLFMVFYSFIKEFLTVMKVNKSKRIDCAIISTTKVHLSIYYKIISKIFRFSIILNYMELCSSMATRKKILKLNDIIFERFILKLFDGIWPISDLLEKVIDRCSVDIPTLKIPILADFDYKFKNDYLIKEQYGDYFLFCGAVEYIEIIEFIINSFDLLDEWENVRLLLILNGSNEYFDKLDKIISLQKKKREINILSDLRKDYLYSLYQNALSLLIPLRPTLQDNARFPHKIGEFLASGRPIITTNIGEVKKYFIDEVNAFIIENYNVSEYAEKMKKILQKPDLADEVGVYGRSFGYKNFHYLNYANLMKLFIKRVSKN